MPAPKKIKELVKRFRENLDEVKSKNYDETTLRVEYVNNNLKQNPTYKRI